MKEGEVRAEKQGGTGRRKGKGENTRRGDTELGK